MSQREHTGAAPADGEEYVPDPRRWRDARPRVPQNAPGETFPRRRERGRIAILAGVPGTGLLRGGTGRQHSHQARPGTARPKA